MPDTVYSIAEVPVIVYFSLGIYPFLCKSDRGGVEHINPIRNESDSQLDCSFGRAQSPAHSGLL